MPPATFMDLMNRVFKNYLDAFVILFINDILVYSKSEDEHMGHLRVMLQIIMEHQLFSKYNKCEFWLRLVAFLGHIISSKGVKFDPRKTKVVKNWPTPLDPTNIKSFLGLVGYYRRFVEGFASISSHLTISTQKKVKFEWSEACERSFRDLKDRNTSSPVFTLSEGTKGFVV